MNNDWIPCSERVPEPTHEVLTVNRYGDMDVVVWNGKRIQIDWANQYDATHWMPLPEKPFDNHR